jgi:hypothetical protein
MIHKLRTAALLGGILLTAGWNAAPAQQIAQPPAAQPPAEQVQGRIQSGVEVLAYGPVHEAFAQPYAADPEPTPVVPKAPPPPVAEQPPEVKPDGSNVQWVPGSWSWSDERKDYIWVSGVWRAAPPRRQWHAGRWFQDADGYRWVHGYWDATAPGLGAQTVTEPPPPSLEQGPSAPAPNDDCVYLPGSWVLTAAGYRWRPGFWTAAREDWVWSPDQYYWSPSGYSYVPGYWDYALADRGELFAPVAFDSAVYATPGFSYCPSYVVGYGGLLSSLFVRPDFGCYYFGDYYGRDYLGAGFYPWFSYGYGSRRYDPLWAYHNWYYPRHGQFGWYDHYRGLYDGRVRGDYARPPRTLAQQAALLNHNLGRPNGANGGPLLTQVSQVHQHLGPRPGVNGFGGTVHGGPKASVGQFRGASHFGDFGAGVRPDLGAAVNRPQQFPAPPGTWPGGGATLPHVVSKFSPVAPRPNAVTQHTPPQTQHNLPQIQNGFAGRGIPDAAPARVPFAQGAQPGHQFRPALAIGSESQFRPAPNIGGARPMPNVSGARPNVGGGHPVPNFGGARPSFGGARPGFGGGQPIPSFSGARAGGGGGHHHHR